MTWNLCYWSKYCVSVSMLSVKSSLHVTYGLTVKIPDAAGELVWDVEQPEMRMEIWDAFRRPPASSSRSLTVRLVAHSAGCSSPELGGRGWVGVVSPGTALLFPRAVWEDPEHGVCSVIPLRPNTWQPPQLCCGIRINAQVLKSWEARMEFSSFQQAACSLDSDSLLWNVIGRRQKMKFWIWGFDFSSWGS